MFEKNRSLPQLWHEVILANHLENLKKRTDMRRALLAEHQASADGRIFVQPIFWSPDHLSLPYLKSDDG